ncbi:conserved protein of unknown function [Rhodovastum atsumiense]|nr:DUF4142 domain-containing protein [Rhodovastum atsumiense]CAH2600848.1 conserved protein of unknown function [Rhodovastum atsumiense]
MANAQDSRFVAAATKSGIAEIREGTLAIQRSPNIAVQEYGFWMQTDHTVLNQLLATAARAAGIPVPTTLDPEQQAGIDRLSRLHGAAFSRAFLPKEVTDHQEALAVFRTEVQRGQDPGLVRLARTSIPVIAAHLTEAQTLQAAHAWS